MNRNQWGISQTIEGITCLMLKLNECVRFAYSSWVNDFQAYNVPDFGNKERKGRETHGTTCGDRQSSAQKIRRSSDAIGKVLLHRCILLFIKIYWTCKFPMITKLLLLYTTFLGCQELSIDFTQHLYKPHCPSVSLNNKGLSFFSLFIIPLSVVSRGL